MANLPGIALSSKLFLALSLLALPAFVRGGETPPLTDNSGQASPVRIMPLGDSITLGLSVAADGGYRKPLQNMLNAGSYKTLYVGKEDGGKPEDATAFSKGMANGNHEGYGSFGIDDVIHGSTKEGHTGFPIEKTMANDNPDVVLLMLGTNNCVGSDSVSHEDAQMKQLLDAIYQCKPGVTVVLASIPPMRDPQREARVNAFNASLPGLIVEQRAKKRKITFADVHAGMNSGDDLVYDGVHPSSAGYRKMATIWYKALTGK